MRIPMHHRHEWKLALRIAFPLLIFTILLDLFFHPAFIARETLETLEILLSGFLFIDILLNLNEARNKYSFLKRNAVRILVIFPFAFVFRILWVLELEYLMSPVIFGEWLPGLMNLQKMLKLERTSLHLAAWGREFFGL
ncbi:MAG TPA: hypothetical protein VJH24_03130 [Candidatus Bilamarchaeaceae archaeon]|nr:hypothetical protein [Candidatus Bilamarchaeaceae archaeon]